jgi:hypothetical protein
VRTRRDEPGLPYRPRYQQPAAPPAGLEYARPGLDEVLPVSHPLRLGSALGISAVAFGFLVVALLYMTGPAVARGALGLMLGLSVAAAVIGFPATIFGVFRRRSRGWLLHFLVGFLFNGIVLAAVGVMAYVITHIVR